jgi:hypothetical protein
MENCYGGGLTHCWVSTGSRVPLVLSGAGCVYAVTGCQIYDEASGADLVAQILLRGGMATFTGCGIQRGYTTPGTVVAVDAGGSHLFSGGQLVRHASFTGPIFDLAGVLDGPIRAVGVAGFTEPYVAEGREADIVVS